MINKNKLQNCFYSYEEKVVFFKLLVSFLLFVFPGLVFGYSIEELVDGVHVQPNQQLRIPISLDSDSFAVLKLRSRGVVSHMVVESLEGEVVVESQFPDLYLEQRLFMPPKTCLSCFLSIKVFDHATEEAKIRLNYKEFSVSKTQRLRAEKHMNVAFEVVSPPGKSDYQIALDEYLASQLLWSSTENQKELMNSLYVAGDAASGFESERMRPDQFQQLLSLGKANNEWFVVARASVRLGRNRYVQDDYVKASQYYRQALEYSNQVVDPYYRSFAKGEIYHELAQVALNEGNGSQFNEYITKSLKYYSEIGAYAQKADVLNTQGLKSRDAKEFYSAALFHERAYQYVLNYPHSQAVKMRTLYYLSVVNALQGKFFYALRMLEEAEIYAKNQMTVLWLAHIKAAKARVYMELGYLEASLDVYSEVESLYRRANSDRNILTVYTNLSRLHRLNKDLSLAREYLEKARQSKNKGEIVRILNAEAALHIENGDVEGALKIQRVAVNIAKENGHGFDLGRTKSQLGEIYFMLGRFVEAASEVSEAIKFHEKSKDEIFIARSNFIAAKISHKNGKRIEEVNRYLDRSINTIEKVRASQLRDDVQQQYLSLQKSVYEFQLQVLLSNNPDKSNKVEALHTSELFRARTLFEDMYVATTPHHLLPSELSKRQEQLKVWDKSLLKGDHAGNKLIEESLKDLLKRESQAFTDPLTVNEIHKIISEQPPGEATLIFFIGEFESWMWLLVDREIELHRLPKGDTINELVMSYVKKVDGSVSMFASKDLWGELHRSRLAVSELVLNGIKEKLNGIHHINIVPDGVFHLLAFDSLYNLNSMKPLTEEISLSYNSSLATGRLTERAQNTKAVPNSLLLLSNSQPMDVKQDQASKLALTAPSRLSRIRFADKEADQIHDLWLENASGTVEYLKGERANKPEWYSIQPQQYEVLHFATHVLVNWDFPSSTAISLSSAKNSSNLETPNLTLQEVSRLALNAELIVLSGCETARGSHISGEGPMGLSRAFFAAGSKRVIASLWPVEDEVTAYLMTQFYQYLTTASLSPAESLKKAKQATSKDPRWRHPHFWAGFALYGDKDHWRE